MELPNFSNKKHSIDIRLIVGHELLHRISPEMNCKSFQTKRLLQILLPVAGSGRDPKRTFIPSIGRLINLNVMKRFGSSQRLRI